MLTSGASARIARAVELAKRVALKSDCATESAPLKSLRNRQRNALAIFVNGQRYAADEQPTQHKQFLSHRAIGEYLCHHHHHNTLMEHNFMAFNFS